MSFRAWSICCLKNPSPLRIVPSIDRIATLSVAWRLCEKNFSCTRPSLSATRSGQPRTAISSSVQQQRTDQADQQQGQNSRPTPAICVAAASGLGNDCGWMGGWKNRLGGLVHVRVSCVMEDAADPRSVPLKACGHQGTAMFGSTYFPCSPLRWPSVLEDPTVSSLQDCAMLLGVATKGPEGGKLGAVDRLKLPW